MLNNITGDEETRSGENNVDPEECALEIGNAKIEEENVKKGDGTKTIEMRHIHYF